MLMSIESTYWDKDKSKSSKKGFYSKIRAPRRKKNVL